MTNSVDGAQWLSGRVLDSIPRGRGFEPNRLHYVVSLSKVSKGAKIRNRYNPRHVYPSLVLVQPRKTRPYITERLLMGRKESIKQKVWTQIRLLLCSGSTLFANSSVMLDNYLQQTTSADDIFRCIFWGALRVKLQA